MEQSRAAQIAEPTPIFGAYRRGYDPDQVDQYVSEQHHRLESAEARASDAERKLAAAVNQLRELHRRVGVLEEHQQRAGEPIRIDGVGEHIQRMFEEARQGAESLRSSTESELAGLREKTIAEARSIVAGAHRKGEEIEAEIERRRHEQLDRLEEERSRAATQLTHLHEQRKNAVAELLRLRDVIDSTITEASAESRARSIPDEEPQSFMRAPREEVRGRPPARESNSAPRANTAPTQRSMRSPIAPDPRPFDASGDRGFDTARLVREHRAKVGGTSELRRFRAPAVRPAEHRPALSIFDYEAQ